MIGNDQHHKQTTILTLQRSCGSSQSFSLSSLSPLEPEWLCSSLLSVALLQSVCPLANKFFDTGLGFSLVILSWAVNRLREVIIHVNRRENKPCSSLKGDEIINNVERSIKEVYFRAATVLAVFALRTSDKRSKNFAE
ncbi:hypothetical protein Bca52824_044190 [Brassica carinata]|uniref:Uncharacterized protein n=1 Tax=Brassica carinata TaxID=52824 RepID=A0A8X7S0Y7_BRACI|nr:hypothetical protein Bca52824_044190 [Brassica carinata]